MTDVLASQLIGREVAATDGAVGTVDDLLFDDSDWTVRYFVLATGSRMSRESVVLPVVKAAFDAERKLLEVACSKETVAGSPDIAVMKPVSREAELLLGKYWQWTPPWVDQPLSSEMGTDIEREATAQTRRQAETAVQTRLRSAEEVRGYRIAARDKTMGKIEDFAIDTSDWSVIGIRADTRRWLPGGQHVFVPRRHLAGVQWAEESLAIDLTADELRS